MARDRKLVSIRKFDTKKRVGVTTTYETDCWCCQGRNCEGEDKTCCYCIHRGEKACVYCRGGKIRFTKTEAQSKYLFIGGPLDGKIAANPSKDYCRYNNAEDGPSQVFIHESILAKDNR